MRHKEFYTGSPKTDYFLFLSLQFYYDDEEYKIDTLIEPLTLSIFQASQSFQSVSPVSPYEKLNSLDIIVLKNNPFYSCNVTLAKKGKISFNYLF